MKINTIIKISLITILSLGFISCTDSEEKHKEIKASLPMPGADNLRKMGLIGEWRSAKKDPIPATKIGYAYSEELKDYKKAIQWYKYSDSMKPMPENSNYACYAYQQLKQYEEAIKWCTNAVELGSDEALIGLGSAYNESKQYTKAILSYKKAYEKKQKDASHNIGFTYSNMKDYKNAELWYLKAIEEGNLSAYQGTSTFFHDNLKDNIKASAYAIALINTKYSKSSVLRLLQKTWKIPNEVIKKGYEYQLNSKEIPIKYTGKLELE
jgi:tetratricopeptide (TPR) repeat protein